MNLLIMIFGGKKTWLVWLFVRRGVTYYLCCGQLWDLASVGSCNKRNTCEVVPTFLKVFFFFFFNNTELEVLGGVKILHDPLESPQTQELNNHSATFHSISRFQRGEKEMVKSVSELQVEDLVNAGLTLAEANELYRVL